MNPTLAFGLLALSAALPAAGKLEYNRDVRPILAENCFPCHGPDSASRKADLRLDRREAALEAGAFEPGKPEESELVKRIDSSDPEERMPPPASKKALKDGQREVLRRWIEAGAEYQPHWAFIAPRRPEPPAVKDEAWVRSPIDRFILAKLEEQGLAPAPEADRRALARRASLDLTGLPPPPEVVEAFVTDADPRAYEALVDRLLESKAWGEHRARCWLDAARYADTHGLHFDNFREMWSYRDWVTGAFNRNLPFDRFTVEQLAGDLLPDRTLDQLVASGFNRCNITTNEGGVIPEEYLVLYTRDRTETVAQVWLGLTANCATCHDHKFDPLTQREFYSMAAFFNNTTQGAMDGNIKDTPPVVPVPRAEDRERWDALAVQVPEARKHLEARKQAARGQHEAWLATLAPGALAAAVPSEGLRLHAPLGEGAGSVKIEVDGQPREVKLPDGTAWEAGHVAEHAIRALPPGAIEVADAGDFERDQAFSVAAWIKLSKSDTSGAIASRMKDEGGYRGWDFWLEDGRAGMHVVHDWPGDALKVVSRGAVKAGEWTHVLAVYDGSSKAAGVSVYLNGKLQDAERPADALKGSIRTQVPFKVLQRGTQDPVKDASLQDLRVYDRALSAEEAERLARGMRAAWLVSKPAEKRSDAEKAELFEGWLATADREYQDLASKLAALEREQDSVKARGTLAHVAQEKGEPAMAYVLFRGEYDKRRDPVKPATPEVFPPMPAELPRDRLGFAKWLLLPEHPLTARVTVNRFWQEVFGTGIVRTAGDFGSSGELPSHPGLLDWLAVELRESGWDVKRFFRLLVTSAAYRQAAVATPEKLENDPQNRLLSRGPRFRMDAEMIRDGALAASGLLVPRVGGPSVRPYQPEGVWEAVAMPESNTKSYQRDGGESLYRRSLYTFWKRAAPPPSMEVFNAPNRELCTVRRERTNTPLQALVTLNDPQFVEAARQLAQLALKTEGKTARDRLDVLALRLIARRLSAEEAEIVEGTLEDLLAYYEGHPDDARKLISVGDSKPDPALDPSTLAAWTMVANELMNLDETLSK